MKQLERRRFTGPWVVLGITLGLLAAGAVAAQSYYGSMPRRSYFGPGYQYYGTSYYFWPGLGAGVQPWGAGAATQYPMAQLSLWPPTYVTPPTPYVRTILPTYGGIVYRDWDPAVPGFGNVFTWNPANGIQWLQLPTLPYPGQIPDGYAYPDAFGGWIGLPGGEQSASPTNAEAGAPGTLVLWVDPPKAVISVDNGWIGLATISPAGFAALQLPAGKHTVLITHPGFDPVTLQVELKPGETYHLGRRLVPTQLPNVDNPLR